MKDFKNWGVKKRIFSDKNYCVYWHDLNSSRFGNALPEVLDVDKAESYDIALGTKCKSSTFRIKDGQESFGKTACSFCNTSSSPTGEYYKDVCDTWNKWMTTFKDYQDEYNVTVTEKPFLVTLGSIGEPTEHPEFCELLKTIYNSNIVPTYMTNGVILSAWNKPNSFYYDLANRILDYTNKYVAGVVVSFGNKQLHEFAQEAVNALLEKGDTHVNIKYLISTKNSVDEFIKNVKKYGKQIGFHIATPLMACGKSNKSMDQSVFEYLVQRVKKLPDSNIIFHSDFIPFIEELDDETWEYPVEGVSKNIFFKKDNIEITNSATESEILKTIELENSPL
jgi:hypothetical protein